MRYGIPSDHPLSPRAHRSVVTARTALQSFGSVMCGDTTGEEMVGSVESNDKKGRLHGMLSDAGGTRCRRAARVLRVPVLVPEPRVTSAIVISDGHGNELRSG